MNSTNEIIRHKSSKPYKTVKENIEKTGCKLFTEDQYYKNSQSFLVIKCSCGNIFVTTYKIFSRKKNPQNKCPECLFKKYKDLIKQFYFIVKNGIEAEGHILLTSYEEYENTKTKLSILCPLGHIYFKDWNKFNSGQRCTLCSKQKK